MEEIEVFALVARQKLLADQLTRLLTNTKKDGPSRKTQKYKLDRLHTLETIWEEFCKNHNRLIGTIKPDTPYMQGDMFGKVNSNYDELKALLLTITPSDEDEEEASSDAVTAKPLPASRNLLEETTNSNLNSEVEGNSIKTSVADDVLRQLRRQQALIATVQRILSQLESQQSRHYYQVQFATLEKHWHEIEALHHAICEHHDDPSEINYDMSRFIDIEASAQKGLAKLQDLIHYASDTAVSTNPTAAIQLPKITLPKFDGTYSNWKQFHDLFVQMIHSQHIGAAQKMWYLKTNITGEAHRLISHLSISNDNYDSAWNILKGRFENKRLLVASFVEKMLAQPQIAIDTASALKNLHDTTVECMQGLRSLGVDTGNWDPIVLHILIKRLDRNTHAAWEQSLKDPRALQSLDAFLKYIETRFQSLEALGKKASSNDFNNRRSSSAHKSLTTIAKAASHCLCCKDNHQLYYCPKFLKLSPSQRLNIVKGSKVCINCLKEGHSSSKCPSGGCRMCSKRHNTLLHLTSSTSSTTPCVSSDSPASCPSTSLTTRGTHTNESYVFLSSAIIRLTNRQGQSVECKAILDSGSQLNFITEGIVRKLGLTTTPLITTIEGIGRHIQRASRRVNIELRSRINNFATNIEAHVLPRITSNQPGRMFDTSKWRIPSNIALADPEFHTPSQIDFLIGAEIFHSLLSVGQIRLGDSLPTLQNTVLGWTVAGRVKDAGIAHAVCGICSADEALDQQIEKFWKLEDHETREKGMTAAEKRCDTHFNQTVSRNSDGRFVVSLPFVDQPNVLGESRDIAFQRFISLERRLANSQDLKKQYVEFMQEYRRLGHMEEINYKHLNKPYYFLPHHCVTKSDSSTTKLRVVFDGSAKTTTNLSLNDILATGPTIQDDVFSILVRFRMPRFVFTADIEKMYRQVLIHETDTKYQLIWWRDSPSEPLKCFKLNTVTYGTRSAPYLATKCLQKLARDTEQQFPLGSKVLLRDFYVDDVMTGSDSLTMAQAMQSELQELLAGAGFKLRKWCTNHESLIRNIPLNDRETKLDFTNNIEEHIKTVGMTWLPKSDFLCIKTSWIDSKRVTKRSAYSDIAHLFDPLGIMAPVIVTAKLFLQQLWELKYDWDAALPQDMQTTWLTYREDLKSLHDIKIPRHVFSNKVPKIVQYHIFADASEKAYGAAAYVRAVNTNNEITVRLLCAKSRVAPSKKTKLSLQTTIPRLELCAAKLAAELMLRLQTDLDIQNNNIFLWTDSTIVLNWINLTSSDTLPVFVANRVAAIQQLTAPHQWRHVSSKENPADILSRGLAPKQLEGNLLWFYGPRFLHGAEAIWPRKFEKSPDCPKAKSTADISLSATTEHIQSSECNILDTINHKNSFQRAIRIVSYMLRFKRSKTRQCDADKGNTQDAFLNSSELDQARRTVIKLMQKGEFQDDITNLQKHNEVSRKSLLTTLTPFLDEEGIIRVGGRLESSALQYDAKHPVLMPYSHPFTKLLLMEIHQENKHAGPQTILAIARQRYWPIRGKTLARSIVHNCVFCSRSRPKLLTQMMGNLPADRIQPARPFLNTGIDFCGPIYTHYKLRGKRPQKSYISVFCCFATKACHLELVTDLTSEGFIGALRRFMARRGHCNNIYCDNATNFVGAKNQLSDLTQIMGSASAREKIVASCTRKGCDFNFIPPRSPHFGGLWEAAVKSAKHLLQHTLASASLTYEELETVIIEVEAILNSRPITPMSSSPNDFAALTPGHFLIGEPITSTIDRTAKPEESSILTRWKLVTHVKNEFWRRWSSEYLNQLQHRYKWKERCQNVEPGMMVIMKEDNQPSLKWPIGRIIDAIKGQDGLVRVADVQTATGVFRRAIHRLAPLPIQHRPQPSDKTSSDHLKRHSNDGDNSVEPSLSNRPHEDAPTPRKRKGGLSLGTALVTLFIACAMTTTVNAREIEISRFDSRPGIYFDNIGTSNLVTHTWNLVIYYDLAPYWSKLEAIGNSTRILQHLCERLRQKTLCTHVTNLIHHTYQDLYEDSITFAKTKSQRSKRGAFNIIGNMANSLFGVLDSQYAEEMSKMIEGIQTNENYLLALSKNHTSIIESTINIIRQNQETLDQRHAILQAQLNEVINRINNSTDESYQFKIQQLFSSWSLYTTLLISNVQRTQSAVTSALSDIHQGKISRLLISPHQMKQQAIAIRNSLSSTYRLPIPPDNILELYRIMVTAGQITNNYVIFQIKIPLINSEDLELYRLVPIPAVLNETILLIQPSSTFLAVNRHHDQYYPLTDSELSTCIIVEKTRHLCTQIHPIYHKGAAISKCEMHILNKIEDLSSCQMKLIHNNPVWTKFLHSNQWIYAVTSRTSLNIACKHTATLATIEGSGTLKLQPDCIAKGDFITLRAHGNHSHTIRSSIMRLSEMPNETLFEHINNHLEPTHQYPIRFDKQETKLKRLAAQLDSTQLELPAIVQRHAIPHTIISSTGLLIIIVMIILLCWKFRVYSCSNRPAEYPVAAPRTATEASTHSNHRHRIEPSSTGAGC